MALERSYAAAIAAQVVETEKLRKELVTSMQGPDRDVIILQVYNELLVRSNQHPTTESESAPIKTHINNTHAIAASLEKLLTEGDRVLEGAVGKLRRTPSQSMMRVESLEGLVSGKNSGASTPAVQETGEEVTPVDSLVLSIQEMGFTLDQATAALDLSKRNLEEAIRLLLENPDRIQKQIRDTATRKMLFADKQPLQTHRRMPQGATGQRSISSGLPDRGSASVGGVRRSTSNSTLPWNVTPRVPIQSPLVTGAKNPEDSALEPLPKPFSAFAFIQQQTPPIGSGTSTPTAPFNNLQKGFTSFLGKAMEALQIESGSVDDDEFAIVESPDAAPPELSESFTTYFGTQVRTMYNLRVSVAGSMCDVVFPPGVPAVEEQAGRAQTAAGIYGNNLSACILLLRKRDLEGYGLGKSANREFIKRCRQATEFHFHDIEIQLQKALDACLLDEAANPMINEGDFFITRHSNIRQVHVLFHLIVSDDEIPQPLSSQSNIMVGYRNILKLAHLRDINHLIVPMLFLPHPCESPTPNSTATPAVLKRVETVLKSTKGVIIEQTRSAKHAGDVSGVDRRGRSFQFVVALEDVGGNMAGVEDVFGGVCAKVGEVFRTS
ncbi:hypothetical protein HDU98_009361 [Podochytrium sp. JEL0797]|nr:hypothetical protein HDU98_009361 [Podochytrium sp. JEL0797]